MEEGRRNERKTIYKPVHNARSRHSRVLGWTHRQTAGCSVGQTDTTLKRYTGARRYPRCANPGGPTLHQSPIFPRE